MVNTDAILRLLLPEFLIDFFNITATGNQNGVLHIFFEEKNAIPEELKSRTLNSKGFMPEITVEDFPLRGKSVKLHIKRRRWLDMNSKEIVQRDWNLVASGTRMTQDFAEFLKKICR